MNTNPQLGDSDNNLLFKIAQLLHDDALSGISQTTGDARYVLKSGDTMTGLLTVPSLASTNQVTVASGSIVANAPAVDVSQTWNNVANTFYGIRVAITNTTSAGASALFEGTVDTIETFSARRTGTLLIHRQQADVTAETLNLSKRGTTGDATAAISSGSAISSVETLAWDGTSQGSITAVRVTALEAFTATAHGARFDLMTPAIGATSSLSRLAVSATAVNAQNGAAYQLNGVSLMNPLSVYAAGTVYTLTAVSAAVDFGTTDPIITVTAAGTYSIRARVKVALNAATFAANRTLTVKIRRTNNTAADVANSTTTYIVPITTAITNTLDVIQLPEVLYTTALTNDTLQIFADISTLPSAGTISIDEASIVALRVS